MIIISIKNKVNFFCFFIYKKLDLDFSVWITVWALLLIAGPLLPEGGHISIDFLRLKFFGRSRKLLELCLALITLAYGALITWGSILFLRQLYQRQSIFPRYVAIPKWIVELCVPIGMAIFTVYAFIEVVKAIRKRW